MTSAQWAGFETSTIDSPRPMPVFLNVDGRLVNFLLFHSYPPNEMFFEVAGLSNAKGTVTASYPEREAEIPVHGSDSTTYKYQDAMPCNFPLDHVSIHGGGVCHLKLASGNAKPIPIAQRAPIRPDTGLFLDIMITTDTVGKYASYAGEKVESNSVKVPCSSEELVSARCRFSGVDFPLETSLPASKSPIIPAVMLSGGPIKGLLFFQRFRVPHQVHRPVGTMLAFRVFTREKVCLERAFHVS